MDKIKNFLYACSEEEKDYVIRELVHRFNLSKEDSENVYKQWRNSYVNKSIPNEFKNIRQINFVKEKKSGYLPNLIESIDEIGVCATAKKFKVNAKRLLSIYLKVKRRDKHESKKFS